MSENGASNSRLEPVPQSIRAKAQAFLNAFPHSDVTSKYHGGLFTTYTGLRHQEDLVDKWKAGSFVTSCNGFVANYGTYLGLGKQFSLGDFWIDTRLPNDKKHAWVRAGAGKDPRPGDTFYIDQPNPGKGFNRLHMGIVVSCAGGVWNTIEGGQGGPGLNPPMDIIRRKSEVKHGVKGWVDIQALFPSPYSRPETGARPVPTWLAGWWQVSWRNSLYFYKFEAGNTVRYSKQGIGGAIAGVGNFQMTSESSLTVNWPASGTVERFEVAVPGSMRGRWNNTEQIFAAFLRH